MHPVSGLAFTRALLVSTCLTVSAVGGAAFAQTNPPSDEPILGEVVVTANRQADVISRVPMSISAVTAQSIEQQGLRNIQDLARVSPGVTFQRSGLSQGFDINIRGVYSPVGAPTVGVYLDDVALQKRGAAANLGSFSTATPQLFDLERVEVLKGPQGTLYGGNSMGGTIRFITPTPSLTTYSGTARAEASIQDDGDPSYEAGVAVGGPIIEDKLGFRVSAWGQHTGGWLDHVDLYTRKTIEENTNKGHAEAFRLAVLWAPSQELRVTPSIYYSNQQTDDTDQWMENIPRFRVGAPNVPDSGTPICNGSTISTGCGANTLRNLNGIPLSNYNLPNGYFTPYFEGPYDFYGPYKTPTNIYLDTNGRSISGKASAETSIFMPALTVDYDAGYLQFHSSTAFSQDLSHALQLSKIGTNSTIATAFLAPALTGTCGNGVGPLDFSLGCSPVTFPGFPQAFSEFRSRNLHYSYSQEFRVSSPADARPFNFVAGAYFGSSTVKTRTTQQENDNEMACIVRNLCGPNGYGWVLGQTLLFGTTTSQTNVKQTDQELAAFGEVNWWFTDKLKATGGLRISRTSFDFLNYSGGPHGTGLPLGYTATVAAPFATNYAACPDVAAGCPYLTIKGKTVAKPITPKFGLSYQANERTLLYATAAKGFRPGGVNAPVNPGICAADFAALGITSTPIEFKPDTVWSYEAGLKTNIRNRLTINASAFNIDWKTPQAVLRLAQCGRTYTGNAGQARITGGDIAAQARVVTGLTITGSFAYQDARYTEDVFGLGSNNPPRLFYDGEPIPLTPKYSATLGFVWDFDVAGLPAFIRADYEYRGKYVRGTGPGNAGYDGVIRDGDATDFVSGRVGVRHGQVEFNLYAVNLTNSRDILNEYHVAVQAPQVMATTFRPRQIGVQINYRY